MLLVLQLFRYVGNEWNVIVNWQNNRFVYCAHTCFYKLILWELHIIVEIDIYNIRCNTACYVLIKIADDGDSLHSLGRPT